MPAYQQADFTDRYNFGSWLNSKGLIGDAAEIGTHRGEFANKFLYHWSGKNLYCVDHWKAGYDIDDPASQGDREADYVQALSVLAQYQDRVTVLKMNSTKASFRVADGQLDFVYIDACHRTESVLSDLLMWYPKLKPGGVLAGHDFLELGGPWGPEVQPAVNKFADYNSLIVYLVAEPLLGAWSYYMIKPTS